MRFFKRNFSTAEECDIAWEFDQPEPEPEPEEESEIEMERRLA